MTGEMSKSDVTREAFPLHFAIAAAFKGATVKPFDVYQGPYVYVPRKGRVWIVSDGDSWVKVYSERLHKESEGFDFYWPDAAEIAADLARDLLRA